MFADINGNIYLKVQVPSPKDSYIQYLNILANSYRNTEKDTITQFVVVMSDNIDTSVSERHYGIP